MLQCFCMEALHCTSSQLWPALTYNFLLLPRELILCSWWKLHQQDFCRSRSEKMLQSWKELGGEAGCTSWPLLLTDDCCSGQPEIKAVLTKDVLKHLWPLRLGQPSCDSRIPGVLSHRKDTWQKWPGGCLFSSSCEAPSRDGLVEH